MGSVSKLTEREVATIRGLLAAGVKGIVIARRFCVGDVAISQIKSGRRNSRPRYRPSRSAGS